MADFVDDYVPDFVNALLGRKKRKPVPSGPESKKHKTVSSNYANKCSGIKTDSLMVLKERATEKIGVTVYALVPTLTRGDPLLVEKLAFKDVPNQAEAKDAIKTKENSYRMFLCTYPTMQLRVQKARYGDEGKAFPGEVEARTQLLSIGSQNGESFKHIDKTPFITVNNAIHRAAPVAFMVQAFNRFVPATPSGIQYAKSIRNYIRHNPDQQGRAIYEISLWQIERMIQCHDNMYKGAYGYTMVDYENRLSGDTIMVAGSDKALDAIPRDQLENKSQLFYFDEM